MPAAINLTAEKSRSTLIVESSRSYASILAAHCRQLHMEPVVCDSIGQALTHIPTLPNIASITVAAHLKDGEGIDLIYSLRAQPHLASTPILFITSHEGEEIARTALVAGATEVCVKTAHQCVEEALSAISVEPGNPLSGGRALIVEDDGALARLLASVCAKLGLTVDLADSVEQAMALFHEQRYQVVVSDVILTSNKTGLDLVRQIRQMPDVRARVPVLVTSSYNDTARRLEILRSGADTFLAKPFLAEEMFWRLRNLLERVCPEPTPEPTALPNGTSPRSALSEREIEIAEAVAQGLSDKEIALRLTISFWTVRSHINRIFSKLGLFNRASLVKYMMQAQDGDNGRSSLAPHRQ